MTVVDGARTHICGPTDHGLRPAAARATSISSIIGPPQGQWMAISFSSQRISLPLVPALAEIFQKRSLSL